MEEDKLLKATEFNSRRLSKGSAYTGTNYELEQVDSKAIWTLDYYIDSRMKGVPNKICFCVSKALFFRSFWRNEQGISNAYVVNNANYMNELEVR